MQAGGKLVPYDKTQNKELLMMNKEQVEVGRK